MLCPVSAASHAATALCRHHSCSAAILTVHARWMLRWSADTPPGVRIPSDAVLDLQACTASSHLPAAMTSTSDHTVIAKAMDCRQIL